MPIVPVPLRLITGVPEVEELPAINRLSRPVASRGGRIELHIQNVGSTSGYRDGKVAQANNRE
jgi:hypothetical protein